MMFAYLRNVTCELSDWKSKYLKMPFSNN